MSVETLTDWQRWRSLAAVIAGALGVGIAFGALVPLLALRLDRDGWGSSVIGANAAMFPLAVLAIGPFLPWLLGRLGTMRSIYAGLAVAGATILLYPLLPDLAAWFLLRFVGGAATAINWVVSETWMNMIATSRNRTQVMSIYATVLAAGFASGPLVIGATGIDGFLPFLVAFGALSLSVVPLTLVRGLAPPMPHRQAGGMRRCLRAAPTVMAAALAGGFVDTALFALLPVYALGVGFRQSTAVLLLSLFIAGNLFLQYPLGLLADRTDRRAILLVCAAIGLAGALLLPLLVPGGSIANAPLLWLMLVVWGGTSFGIYTIGLSLLGDRFRGAELAGANTVFVMFYEFGSFTGPVVAGGAMDLWNENGLPVAVAAAAAGFLLLGLLRTRRQMRRE